MNLRRTLMRTALFPTMILVAAGGVSAQEAPRFTDCQFLTNGEMLLELTAAAGLNYRIEASTNLGHWHGLATALATGPLAHTDGAAPYLPTRYYRVVQLTNANAVTGDHLVTADGEVVIHPVTHATLVMKWNDKLIYVDPTNHAPFYAGLPRADLILLTHNHSDHYSSSILGVLTNANTVILAPQVVFNAMPASLRSLTTVLGNGARANVLGLTVDAIPAYNTTSGFHAPGTGNGYVLTIGGRRLYVSGDTEDIPEMRALINIDVAFLCMNRPYTMTVTQAVSAVRAFRPAVVYPYHYRNSDATYTDVNGFKQQVGTDLRIEIRLRKWYSGSPD